jgi:kynurenine 3-monooxygenase
MRSTLRSNEILVTNHEGIQEKIPSNVIIGADGAYSALRNAMLKQVRFDYKQEYISHGYKELTIPATEAGEFAMDPNALAYMA